MGVFNIHNKLSLNKSNFNELSDKNLDTYIWNIGNNNGQMNNLLHDTEGLWSTKK